MNFGLGEFWNGVASIATAVGVLITGVGVVIQFLQLRAERRARESGDRAHEALVRNQIDAIKAEIGRREDESRDRHINYLIPVCFIVIHATAKAKYYFKWYETFRPPVGRDAVSAMRSHLKLIQSDCLLTDVQMRALFGDYQYDPHVATIILVAHRCLNRALLAIEALMSYEDPPFMLNQTVATMNSLFENLFGLREAISEQIGGDEPYYELLFMEYESHGLSRMGEWRNGSDSMAIAKDARAGEAKAPLRDWLETGLPPWRGRTAQSP